MDYSQELEKLKQDLLELIASSDEPRTVLRHKSLKSAYAKIKEIPNEQKASYGQAVNAMKTELEQAIADKEAAQVSASLPDIDVTAPFDVNVPANQKPKPMLAQNGSIHPISREIEVVSDIFYRMGFEVSPSREIDDDYHMFTSLNFPEDHPARDDYDTFMTEDGLVAPAHTSTMQNRIIQARKRDLENGKPIAVLAVDRVFRNEDVDARHEHTFTQYEGVYVGENITVGNLVATLKLFFATYYEKDIDVKITPFYFPFTEPSFEFSLSCPFCSENEDCKVCSSERWIEMLGCGMIHPNVLKMAGVDPKKYTGFAWGGGIERLVMLKYGIEDVRHFNSGKLPFLKQFGGIK